MTKILLAFNQENYNRLQIYAHTDETKAIEQAKQDAKELIKQAKLELIGEIIDKDMIIGNTFGQFNVVRVEDILLIKSEIEKE